MGNRFFQLLGELHAGNWEHRAFLLSILGALCCQLPQNHLRMIDKVAVQGQSLRRLPEVYPVRLNVDRMIPLLQEDDIRHDICPGIGTESIVRQTDSPQKLRPLRKVLSYLR